MTQPNKPEAMREIIEEKNRIISAMDALLISKGVNFDFANPPQSQMCTPDKLHSFHSLGGIDDCPVCNPNGEFNKPQSQSDVGFGEWWFLNGGMIHRLWKQKQYSDIKDLAMTLPKEAWNAASARAEVQFQEAQGYIEWQDKELIAAKQEIERLKVNMSARRCGECGNIGMTSIGLEMSDEIEKHKETIHIIMDRRAEAAQEIEVLNRKLKVLEAENKILSTMKDISVARIVIPTPSTDTEVRDEMEKLRQEYKTTSVVVEAIWNAAIRSTKAQDSLQRMRSKLGW